MKLRKELLLLPGLFLAACSSDVMPATTIPKPPTAESLTASPSAVPHGIDITCEQVSNPDPKPAEKAGENPYIPEAEVYRICTFSGQVSRGETYRQQMTTDLVFCLVPGGASSDIPDEGWDIIISDTRPGSCDVGSEDYVNFGPIVTPPFYGNLFFNVYGWHFRNADNSGKNDGSVNAPQEKRELYFLFNREDYETALHALNCVRWAVEADCALATRNSTEKWIPTSLAEFTIKELELGNLVPGSHAWIEHMQFQVRVYLPAE